MRNVAFFITFVLVSCITKEIEKEQYDFVEPPEVDVVPDGRAFTVRWKPAKGTDIAGYYVYWDKYKNKTGEYYYQGSKEADAGKRLQYSIFYDAKILYRIYLKSYDFRGNKSLASKLKFYPQKPDDWDGGVGKFSVMDPWTGNLYKTHDDITIAWDPFDGETKWEVKMHFINDPDHIGIHNYGETTLTTFTMSRPGGVVGLCEFFIRAYKDGAWQEWHSSDSEAGDVTINGQQIDGNWIAYWMLAPPVWE